jgi:predicted esterase
MSISSRAVRRAAVVCLAAATSLASVFVSRAATGSVVADSADAANLKTTSARAIAKSVTPLDTTARGRHSSAPMKLRGEGRDVLAFAPPKATGEHPLTVVYLHGVHGRAENGCPWLRSGASELGWLVCPEASVRDEGGTASWGGDVFAQSAVVSNALRAAQQNGASSEPGVAVGFSQGSYVALDLVKTRLAHFRGLVLLAAPEAHPSAERLRAAGIVRIALGAGSLDAAYGPLVEDTKRLASEGIEARFFDLGKIGHTYAAENPETLREAITWAGGKG